MKNPNQMLALASVAAALSLGSGNLTAQERPGRGNFDPEQMRQRMMERYRERLEVKSDEEWKAIQPLVQKVSDARREAAVGGFAALGGGRGGGGGGGGGGRGAFGPEPSPEADALQKAIESNASADEVKSKLAKLREARKQKEANLEKAQEDLRKVLSVRQEASAVLLGLLK